jgi:glycine cleavage system aminomethyltransferase T
MSIHAAPQPAVPTLDALHRRAGAVTVDGAAGPLVVNYGSAAGELAACVTAAGVADCSWLCKLELSGPAGAVDDAVRRLTGSTLARGGVLHAVSAWWCAPEPGRVIVLCERAIGDRLHSLLEVSPAFDAAVQVSDRSAEWTAIAVVGRRAADVLAGLGVYGTAGDPRTVAPFTAARAGSVPALWLLASDRRTLALIPCARAGEAWMAIERAGRDAGICCVGRDALARYALLDGRTPKLPGV